MLKEYRERKRTEPKPDIARCNEWGWEGPVAECIKGEDGDWESGYFEVDECPRCDDPGDIDYRMSPERAREWNEWNEKKGDGGCGT